MFRKVLLVLAAIFFVVACGHYERTAQESFRVEWAACNLGAFVPEEPGTYFAWGETAGKDHYGWDNYLYSTREPKMTKYNPAPGTQGTTVLDPGDDAATVILGNGRRMPTKADWEELVRKGIWKMTVRNGSAGYLVTSRLDGEEVVFLPAGGLFIDGKLRGAQPEIYRKEDGTWSWRGASCHFWTSELRGDYCLNAWYYGLSDEGYGQYYNASRSFGLNIRPVRDK